MSEETETKKPGPLSWVGCGCGCLSGLVALAGVMGIVAVLLGAINYSASTTVYGSAGGALCVGLVGGIIGIAMYIFGQRPAQ
jgi:hypothetical protein